MKCRGNTLRHFFVSPFGSKSFKIFLKNLTKSFLNKGK